MNESIYLDNNATAPTRMEVIRAVEGVMASVGNPSSVHRHGRNARKILEQARRDVARLCNVSPEMVTFTSGGTEANNIVLQGAGRQRVLMSAVEHPSVREACPDAEIIPVDHAGVIDLGVLETMLASDGSPALVSVMAANNETGVIQPVSRIANLAHQHGALVHCDGVQAVGKYTIDVTELGVDFLVLSSHKIGGTAGCGAIINRNDLPLEPLVHGGGQERKVRSGTENLVGIAGLGAAAAAVLQNGEAEAARMKQMRDRLEGRITEQIPSAIVVGVDAERLVNTSCLILPGIISETQVMALDLAGISVSAGSACSSGKVSVSPVLDAMGYAENESSSAIRVSFGWANDDHDVERFVDAFIALYERARDRQSAA
ncbi:MAG: cysteine desulfurase [Rhodospirillales bacterium]|nr:cysteine desulfurase [Rhodospirillales bacterium]